MDNGSIVVNFIRIWIPYPIEIQNKLSETKYKQEIIVEILKELEKFQ